MLSNRLSAAVLLLTVGVAACANSGDTANGAQQAGQAALPAGHPSLSATPSGGATLTGTVLETMDAANYTYARLKTGDREIWVAGPVTPLEVGQDVALASTMDMGKFTSSALNRTFDQMYFTDGFLKPGEAPAAGSADPTAGGTVHGGSASGTPASGAPAMASGRATAGERTGTVKQSIKAAGYTYIEVDADGQSVWLAAPEMDLDDGAAIAWNGGLIMKDFSSKTLNRTFPEILFVSDVQVR